VDIMVSSGRDGEKENRGLIGPRLTRRYAASAICA
jgi:hypothetical protein